MPKQLRIVHYPDAVLRRKTKYVKGFGPALVKAGEQMLELMGELNGIGLAAPQVGMSKKLIVIGSIEEAEPVMLANPKVIWQSEEQGSYVEGCLSLPEVEGPVVRPLEVRVKAQALDTGEEIEIELELFARVLQHEIDHLNAVLFIDHLVPRDRHEVEPALRDLEFAVA